MPAPPGRVCSAPGCTNPTATPGAALCLPHIDAVFASKGLRRVGEYRKAAEPIEAVCLECGTQCSPRLSTLQTPERGGCPSCGIRRRARSKTVPFETAQQEFLAAGLRITGDYVNVNSPVDVVCLVCGTPGRTRLNVLRRGDGGCRPCGTHRANSRKRTSQETIEGALIAAGLEMIGPYINKSTPVPVHCMTCGKVSDIWMSTVYGGGGCRHCSHQRTRERLQTDPEQVRIALLAAGFQLVSPYINNSSTLELLCMNCGQRGDRAWKRFRQGQRACRTCDPMPSPRPRVSTEVVRAEFLAKGLQMIGEYHGSGAPVRAMCLHCGSECSPRLDNLRNGQGGCAVCAKHRIGKTLRAPLESVIALFDARDLDFIGPYVSAATPTVATCRRCGRTRRPKPNALRTAGGCRPCGYAKEDVEGYLYLIDFDMAGERFRKVGIGRVSSGRVEQHRSAGGQVSQLLYAPFVECYEAEQRILTEFAAWSYRPIAEQLKGGHTECFYPDKAIDLRRWLPRSSDVPLRHA